MSRKMVILESSSTVSVEGGNDEPVRVTFGTDEHSVTLIGELSHFLELISEADRQLLQLRRDERRHGSNPEESFPSPAS